MSKKILKCILLIIPLCAICAAALYFYLRLNAQENLINNMRAANDRTAQSSTQQQRDLAEHEVLVTELLKGRPATRLLRMLDEKVKEYPGNYRWHYYRGVAYMEFAKTTFDVRGIMPSETEEAATFTGMAEYDLKEALRLNPQCALCEEKLVETRALIKQKETETEDFWRTVSDTIKQSFLEGLKAQQKDKK
ncbi:hypothetical protein AAIR98_001123 [Elusimicrobium simillimum]|uniref:hypothetical protein n=1 Tax=Elusimicrobium simillimum TaxID=3143438 RepID=UPI003C6FC519